MHASSTRIYFPVYIKHVRLSAPDFCLFGAAGEDGPSQMGLEDLAMFRAIPTATVFYPSDGVSTEKAVELAANTKVPIAGCSWGLKKYLKVIK